MVILFEPGEKLTIDVGMACSRVVSPHHLCQVSLEVGERGPIYSSEVVFCVLPRPLNFVSMNFDFFVRVGVLVGGLECPLMDDCKMFVAKIVQLVIGPPTIRVNAGTGKDMFLYERNQHFF